MPIGSQVSACQLLRWGGEEDLFKCSSTLGDPLHTLELTFSPLYCISSHICLFCVCFPHFLSIALPSHPLFWEHSPLPLLSLVIPLWYLSGNTLRFPLHKLLFPPTLSEATGGSGRDAVCKATWHYHEMPHAMAHAYCRGLWHPQTAWMFVNSLMWQEDFLLHVQSHK